MPISELDSEFLREAIRLSQEYMEAGAGGPFGAVVAIDGKIVGRGWNRVTSSSDPTAHAEVVAIREACQNIGDFSLRGATLYTSCEPCPMCLAAAYWARVDRIVFANTRSDAAVIGFDDESIYRELGLPLDERKLPMIQALREEAQVVFQKWFKKTDKIPY